MLRGYREFGQDAPDEVTPEAISITMPADPHLPSAIHDQQCFIVGAVFAGDADEGMRVMQPLRELASPLGIELFRREHDELMAELSPEELDEIDADRFAAENAIETRIDALTGGMMTARQLVPELAKLFVVLLEDAGEIDPDPGVVEE